MGTSSGVAGGATGALSKDYCRIEGDPASPLQWILSQQFALRASYATGNYRAFLGCIADVFTGDV